MAGHHERHRSLARELVEDPPPVPGRLAGHCRPGEPLRGRPLPGRSKAAPRSHARHRNVRRASTFESWSHTTTICFLSARSIPTIGLLTGTRTRSRSNLALRLRSPRETPLPLPTNVLLLRWDTKPASASGGRSHAWHRRAESLSMPTDASVAWALVPTVIVDLLQEDRG